MRNCSVDSQYFDVIDNIINNGVVSKNRTGIDTLSIFNTSMSFEFQRVSECIYTLPALIRSRKINTHNAIVEFIYMYFTSQEDISFLVKNNVKIWNEWAVSIDENSPPTIGRMYGRVLRHGAVDQYLNVLQTIIEDPDSRRIMMSTYDPTAIPSNNNNFREHVASNKGVLAPCHGLFTHFNVSGDYLDMNTYQRSADMILGIPTNLLFYSLLLIVTAHITGKIPRRMNYLIGDAHIYSNHMDNLNVQREVVLGEDTTALLELGVPSGVVGLEDINREYSNLDVYRISNYIHGPVIKFQVAV